MKLDELALNKWAVIRGLDFDSDRRKLFLALGFTRGARVRVEFYSPFKFSALISIRGSLIALKRNSLIGIEVEPYILKG